MENNMDSSFNEAVARTIKTYRNIRQMSLDDVVRKMKNPISRQMLFKYEHNLARMKTSTFLDICFALNLEPKEAYKRINEFASKIEDEKRSSNPFSDFELNNNLNFDNGNLIDLNSNTIQIPVLGKIPAGMPLEAIEDEYTVDTIDIPKEWIRGNNKYFALKLEGDSMEPDYLDKDIVIFKQASDCESGQDCCIRINGFDATFKRVRKQENGIMVIPLNENNSTGFISTFYSKEDIERMPIEILGIVKQIRRNK